MSTKQIRNKNLFLLFLIIYGKQRKTIYGNSFDIRKIFIILSMIVWNDIETICGPSDAVGLKILEKKPSESLNEISRVFAAVEKSQFKMQFALGTNQKVSCIWKVIKI